MHCITFAFLTMFHALYICVLYVEILCAGRIGLGWVHDVFIIACHMFMHFSCIHTSLFYLFDIYLVGTLLLVSLSLSLSLFRLVCAWHLRASLLHPRTLFVPGQHLLLILLLLLSGFVMIKPVRPFQRTFLDAAFIRNTKSSFQIFLILTFPQSSIVEVRSLFVISRSLVPPWSYRSSTPICMDLITLHLISSLAFEVRVL